MKNFLKSDKEFRFNEVLFENRNKNYGAYVIRNEEGKILAKSLMIGVAFFATLAITPLLVNSFQTPPKIVMTDGGHVLTPIDEPNVKPPEIVKPTVPVQVKVNTVTLDLPTPIRDAKIQTPAKSVKDIENANIGTKDVIGDPPILQNPPVIFQGPTVVPKIEIPKPIDNTPPSKVDIEAKFNGGIDAFRNKVVQNFSAADFEGTGGIIKTSVTFIVEKDGTISGVLAKGADARFNKEAEKTIKNIKGKWAPAKLNGENVRSYFNFPIAMQFE